MAALSRRELLAPPASARPPRRPAPHRPCSSRPARERCLIVAARDRGASWLAHLASSARARAAPWRSAEGLEALVSARLSRAADRATWAAYSRGLLADEPVELGASWSHPRDVALLAAEQVPPPAARSSSPACRVCCRVRLGLAQLGLHLDDPASRDRSRRRALLCILRARAAATATTAQDEARMHGRPAEYTGACPVMRCSRRRAVEADRREDPRHDRRTAPSANRARQSAPVRGDRTRPRFAAARPELADPGVERNARPLDRCFDDGSGFGRAVGPRRPARRTLGQPRGNAS
jgi:hypothetical protein